MSTHNRLKKMVSLITLLACLAGCATAPTASPTPLAVNTLVPATQPPPSSTPMPEKTFRIIGYVTDWDAITSQIQFDKLTHINYAFVIPNDNGTFKDVANPWKLKEVVTKAHEHNVKVLISVGGWGWDDEFEILAADENARTTFVNGLVEYAQEYNLDGLDIDWEYPDPGQSGQNFLALMSELRAALPKDKLLTAAVLAVGETGGGVVDEVFPLIDFLNLMAYDGSQTNHSSMEYAEQSLDYWSERGLTADKMVLGVPFYSRPSQAPYRKLIKANPEAMNVDEFKYLGNMEYYNGLPTIRQKTELAQERASGIMIWALSHDTQDSNSLLKAIYETAYETAQ